MRYSDRLFESILKKRGLRNDRIWIWNKAFLRIARGALFFLDSRALLSSQYWPRDRIERLQRARLTDLMRAASSVPFWNGRMSGFSFREDSILLEFQTLAVISKRDLTELPERQLVNERYVRMSYRDRTSGSTGRPFAFLMDAGYSLRSYAVCERMFRAAANGIRYPVVSVRAREREGFAFHGYSFFFVRSYNALKHRFPEFLNIVKDYRSGFILYGFVSPLVELARLVSEQDPELPVRAVIASGEELRPQTRATIEKAISANVFSCYTAQELGWLAFECSEKKLHLNEETVFIEIVDPDGAPLPEGSEGRIVATPLDHRVMPLIRYFTGDIGTIEIAACACGRTLRTIRIKGREAHMIELSAERSVPLLELASVFDRYAGAIFQYQIVHTGPLIFTMRVVAGASYDRIHKKLRNALMHMLHPSVQLNFELVDQIEAAPSSKAIYYVRTF